jgi:hypothetical protein
VVASVLLLASCVSNVELPLPGTAHPANPDAAAAPEIQRPGILAISAPPAEQDKRPQPPPAPSPQHHHQHNM